MKKGTIITNLYPEHIRFRPLQICMEKGGYNVKNIVRGEFDDPKFDGEAIGQFVFNYPMNKNIADYILKKKEKDCLMWL